MKTNAAATSNMGLLREILRLQSSIRCSTRFSTLSIANSFLHLVKKPSATTSTNLTAIIGRKESEARCCMVSFSTSSNEIDEAEVTEPLEETKEDAVKVDPAKDRSRVISPEMSLKYMESKAYRETYGDEPIWKLYRRNFKGSVPPRKTRKTCIRKNVISTGNPCPICRDEYLVLHYTNVKLLKQFISPHTGEVYEVVKTGICRKQHLNLLVAIYKAKDYGTLTFEVPFRKYDYSVYMPKSPPDSFASTVETKSFQ